MKLYSLMTETPTLDSREVAQMVEKEHKELLRDVRTYEQYLGGSNFALTDYFIRSEYKSSQNKVLPCYQITRKGCELIANKITGEKGTKFSVRYIDKFHEMEHQLTSQFNIPKTYADALRLAADQAETIDKQNQIIGELKPKADYMDNILKNPGLVTITQIAKDYGMTGQAMNALLHDLGIQYKQSDQWLLYKQYSGLGYTFSQTFDITRNDGRPDIKLNTKWTQKGRLFLYELLRGNGVFPEIEKLKLRTM